VHSKKHQNIKKIPKLLKAPRSFPKNTLKFPQTCTIINKTLITNFISITKASIRSPFHQHFHLHFKASIASLHPALSTMCERWGLERIIQHRFDEKNENQREFSISTALYANVLMKERLRG
jgi:hypothetical protein